MATSPRSPPPSPLQYAPQVPPAFPSNLSSPRSARTLRKLQSAQALSSHYSWASNGSSLTSQQRQLHHHRSALLRDPGHSQITPKPEPLSPSLRSRTRANSDFSASGMPNTANAPKRSAISKKVTGPDPNSKEEIESLIKHGPKGDVHGGLVALRRSVLLDGLVADSDGMSQLRIYIWLILLDAPPLLTDTYLALIHRGPSPAYAKIRNDTFRTLATDPLFKRRVSESSLIRLLNALAWTLHDAQQRLPVPTLSPTPTLTTQSTTATSATGSPFKPPRSPKGTSGGMDSPSIYLQGMNVLSAPFLYAARSESEAYTLLHTLVSTHLPSYTSPTLRGVHHALSLLDTCLRLIDPKLSSHLLSHNLTAPLYAFPSVLTLCACTPPLPEVLVLWDFLFSYGVHLNVLCIVAQLVLLREELLASERPGRVFERGFPALKAREVVGMAVSFVKDVPREVYEELVEHVR